MVLCIIQVVAWIMSFKFPWSKKVSDKIFNFLYWGGILRLIMEAYLEMIVTTMLNIKKNNMDWNNYSIVYTNVFSIVSCILLILMPIWVLVFYWRNRERWNEDGFNQRWGAPLDGLDRNPMMPMSEVEIAALDEASLANIFRKAEQVNDASRNMTSRRMSASDEDEPEPEI